MHLRRGLVEINPDRYRPQLASSLSVLGQVLWALGRMDEAVQVTQEAVRIFRDHASTYPDRYLPDLAETLNNVACLLAENGCPAEARVVAGESLAIFQELAMRYPERHLEDVAKLLSNLGAWSEGPEGAHSREEAVGLWRALAENDPGSYGLDLGVALVRLSEQYQELGLLEQALARAEESVTIIRGLTADGTGRFDGDLPRSLWALAEAYWGLERPEESLPPALEAVAILREQAASDQDRSVLGRTMITLALRLAEMDRVPEAIGLMTEGITLRYEAEGEPDSPHLMALMYQLGEWLWSSDQIGDYLPQAQEIVRILRELEEGSGDGRILLAGFLSIVRDGWKLLGRLELSLPPAQQIVAILRTSAMEDQSEASADLAENLTELVFILRKLDRGDEAHAAVEEAIGIWRDLAQAEPEENLPGLGRALTLRDLTVMDQAQWADALHGVEETARIWHEAAGFHPDRVDAVGGSLGNIAVVLVQLGRSAEALPVLEEAAAIWRGLIAEGRDEYCADLAETMLMSMSARHALGGPPPEAAGLSRQLVTASPTRSPELGRALTMLAAGLSDIPLLTEALPAAEEAVALWREQVSADDDWSPFLAEALDALSQVLSLTGHPAEALRATEEAVTLCGHSPPHTPTSDARSSPPP
ncbi:tetratricopeptide repeat protein [Nonomuraea sp. NPDC049152]|uniref:tetratricopeptide repeat protein n=1 Tax=Nonomuraea sp. NPDC049152 TaxID=3154350 RepID=UPI003402B532